ncbi:hypothetical protein [Desulfurivibrio sp. C05AmB]|uniref:hypothetical protein n=1 Tax=Desulfurivibrio sp. C05AmB TaxID=3374371 RepID=UPI00376EE48D
MTLPLALGLLLGLNACSGSDGAPGAPGADGAAGQDVDPALVEDLQRQIDELAARLDEDAPDDGVPVLIGQYAGSKICSLCHSGQHSEWDGSWHTRKTTWGPAVQPEAVATVFNSPKNHAQYLAAAQAKFLPGVINMWNEGQIHSHMILDRTSLADVPDAIKATWPAGVTNVNYVTAKKYDWRDVEVIVGETRKQRYAVYYDGKGPVDAHYQYSVNGGIGWTVDTSATVQYPGNLERAGYKFLTIEIDALKESENAGFQKANMYGEFYSWQERCIGCHTTGFDPEAWSEAKAAYIASEGQEGDLRGIYISEITISCEACHGPGYDHAVAWGDPGKIINPARLNFGDPTRKMACEQCHTRTAGNKLYPGAPNDNRGFILGEHDYMDVMTHVRPAWDTGSRAVSIDGKGRRDHQQDMDIRLSRYAKDGNSFHTILACFDCHDSHGVGKKSGETDYATALVDKNIFTTSQDPDGQVRLTGTREQQCMGCHGGIYEDYLKVLNGAAGWPAAGFGNYSNERGRGDRKQHIFNTDDVTHADYPLGRSYGLAPEQYTWGLTSAGAWVAIWPWEAGLDTYVSTHTGPTKPTN